MCLALSASAIPDFLDVLDAFFAFFLFFVGNSRSVRSTISPDVSFSEAWTAKGHIWSWYRNLNNTTQYV